jgi:outer membrane protein OmpA-like peptidoglycan-associated protein
MDRRAAQLLSEERATTIRNFLLDQAISPNNFIVTGFGNNVTGKQGERVEVVWK